MADRNALTPLDAQILQQAHAMLQAGDRKGAEERVRAVLLARAGQPDALHLLALILKAQDRIAEAWAAADEAARAAPRNAHIQNSLGNLLADMGQLDEALRAHRQAVKLDPAYAVGWANLGLVATQAGQHDDAIRALQRARQLAPQNARTHAALGFAMQQKDAHGDAIDHFLQALEIDPADAGTRHNLAISLRQADRSDDALAQIDAAIAAGLRAPEVLSLRGHLLADNGQLEPALAQYRLVADLHPGHCDTHEALARLLPQIDSSLDAFASYRTALSAAPGNDQLWRSAIRTASQLKDYPQALAWAADAAMRFPGRLDFLAAQASARLMTGDIAGARAQALALLDVSPNDAGLHNMLAYMYLKLKDPEAAEPHALQATEQEPTDQTGWSHLTVIWRLTGDPREDWLADYDRLVQPVTLEPPAGHADMPAFLAALTDDLTALHQMRQHPGEQSLRGGTQTRGFLFGKRSPLIRALAASLQRGIETALQGLPKDDTHPFLSRNSGRIRFTTSWSVRLRSAGFHINHIHPKGWLSSACYISLPPEVEGSVGQGALAFGVPDSTLELGLSARRIVAPKPGQLVLFPSYFWHGTQPFESTAPRLTVAFDALPG